MEASRGQIDRGLHIAGPAMKKAAGTTKMPKLVEAAVHGDLASLDTLLLDSSIDVNELDEESMSALHWASAYGEAHIVQKLLQHPKINPCIHNKRGSTPLHQATLCGTHEVMKVLLADSRVRQEVNGGNMWGETALILAATRGDSAAAAILLEIGGADPALRDKWGKNAEEVAQDHGEHSTAQLFKNYTPGQSLSHIYAPKPTAPQTTTLPQQQKRVLSKLLEAPLDEERALQWIAEPGMDINGADYLKWTALHKCAAWEKPVVVKALLSHADINTTVRGADGDTVLHAAAGAGAARCVNVLLEDGRIKVDEVNDSGITPLMVAAGSGSTDIVHALLSHGADPNKPNPQGKTAWNFAKENKVDWIADLLWEKMDETTRQTSQSLYTPPPPRPTRATGKLSAKLVALQEAVRNKQ